MMNSEDRAYLERILEEEPAEEDTDLCTYLKSIWCLISGTVQYYFMRLVQCGLDGISIYTSDRIVKMFPQFTLGNMLFAIADGEVHVTHRIRLYLLFRGLRGQAVHDALKQWLVATGYRKLMIVTMEETGSRELLVTRDP